MIYSFVIESDRNTYEQDLVKSVQKAFRIKGVKSVSLCNESLRALEDKKSNKRISELIQQMQLVLNELAKEVEG